ncbi:hypothetical protein GQ457_03G025200 [Hibiscus cannabinus]
MAWIEHTVILHFGGTFTRKPKFDYVGGTKIEKKVDPDFVCYPTLIGFIEEAGFASNKVAYLAYLEPGLSLDGGLRILGSDNESYIRLIKHLCSEGEINIYAGHALELDNADVGVEEIDVNDSGFNVEEVEVDDGPNVSPGPTVSHGPTVVDAEPTGVGGLSADAEPTGVAGPSVDAGVAGLDAGVAGPSVDAGPSIESPMKPSTSQAGPSVAGKQTYVSGPTSVDGSTRLETDNVEVGEEGINEGRADDEEEESDYDEESGDSSDLSYRAESESDSEDLRGEVWVTDDEDEELAQIFQKARRFKERRAAGTVGDEDLRQNEDLTGTFHGTEEREEGNAEDTDYLASDDAGSYETDSDGEVVCKKSKKNFFNENSEPRFELGMIFESNIQFKEALRSFAVANRFDYKYTKNEKHRIRAKCKGVGCPFMIYLGKGTDGIYQIKTLVSKHSCSVTFKNKRAYYKFVGKHFVNKLKIMPKLRLTDMMALGKEEIKVELTKNVCSRARKWAVNQIRGNVKKEFNRLYDYVFALREADPTGTFDLVVERPTPNDTPIFRRLYVCFTGLKEGFIRYCRPVLCLDGCYLKGPLKGELLAAVGRDGNNQIFPIAWAVVEVENKETWGWFLKNIQIDLQLGNGDKVTVISDMQKGLLEEIPFVLPNVEHRFCARHMYAHWRKDHKGLDMQQLFWASCKATNVAAFRKHTSRIHDLKGAALEDLMEKDPKYWSRAFFATHSKCDSVDNNFSEAFNSAILPARYKSIISLFEDLRHYVMNRNLAHKLRNESVETYVVEAYKKETYMSLYNYALPILPSEDYWKETKMGPIEPPLKRKLPGRPKQKRKREEGERLKGSKLSKHGSKMSCGCCGEFGHNIRTCPKKITPTDSTMEPPPSQASSHTMPNIDSPMETPQSQASSHTMPTVPNASTRGTIARGRPRRASPRRGSSRGTTSGRIMEGYGIYTNLSNGMQILNPGRPSQRMLRIDNRKTMDHPHTATVTQSPASSATVAASSYTTPVSHSPPSSQPATVSKPSST